MLKSRNMKLIFSILMIVLVVQLSPTSAAETNDGTWPVEVSEQIVLTHFAVDAHCGVDISAPIGADVFSVASGNVSWIGKLPNGAPCMSVTHENGLRTTYLPVIPDPKFFNWRAEKIIIEAGGFLGNLSQGDSSSPEPHLHLGLKGGHGQTEIYFDPLSVFDLKARPINEPSRTPFQSETAAAGLNQGKVFVPNASTKAAVPMPDTAGELPNAQSANEDCTGQLPTVVVSRQETAPDLDLTSAHLGIQLSLETVGHDQIIVSALNENPLEASSDSQAAVHAKTEIQPFSSRHHKPITDSAFTGRHDHQDWREQRFIKNMRQSDLRCTADLITIIAAKTVFAASAKVSTKSAPASQTTGFSTRTLLVIAIISACLAYIRQKKKSIIRQICLIKNEMKVARFFVRPPPMRELLPDRRLCFALFLSP